MNWFAIILVGRDIHGLHRHEFASHCVSSAPLRLCGEEVELEIGMDASGAEDAVGIECTL